MKKFILSLFAASVFLADSFAQANVKGAIWLAPACKTKLYGLQDKGGVKSFSAKFDFISEGDGIGWIAFTSGKYGVINSEGNWIIKPNYENIVQFSNGKAIVGKKKKTKILTQNNEASLYYSGYVDSTVYYGVVDATNTWVIDADYEFLRLCDDGSAQFTDAGSGKFGFLNPDGTIMLRAQYSYATRMTNGVAVIGEPLNAEGTYYSITHRYSYTAANYFVIDRKGNKITTEPHELIREFSEGRAAFNKGGIWKSRRYSEDVRLVGGKWGYLDESGKEIIMPVYDYVYDFKNGKAKVRLGERLFWVDVDGKECPPPITVRAKDFTIFCEPGSYGFIDPTGKWVIEPQFYVAKEFSEGLAAVVTLRTSDLDCGESNSAVDENYENHTMNYSKSLRYLLNLGVDYNADDYYSKDQQRVRMDSIRMVDSIMAIYAIRLYGYIDANGIMVLPAKYEVALPFHNNRAYVSYKGKWGVINRKGDWIMAPVLDWPLGMAYFSDEAGERGNYSQDEYYSDYRMDEVNGGYSDHLLATKFYSFNEGIGGIYKYGKYGFVDSTGKTIVPPIYDEVLPFRNGFAAVRHGGHWGYIDKTGKEIIAVQFKTATSFSKEGLACVGIYPQQNKAVDVNDPSMMYEGDYTIYYGYIDKTGKFAIKPQFIEAAGFSEGLASVSIEYGKHGFIDKTGKFIIQPKYNFAGTYTNGFAQVKINMFEPVFIDKNGKVSKVYSLDNLPFNFTRPLRRKIGSNTYYGFVNAKGEEIIPFQYSNAGNFSKIE